MMRGRKGMTFVSVGVAIAIGFLYFVMSAVALALGKGGMLPPFISAWIAPVVFAMIAIITIESNFAN